MTVAHHAGELTALCDDPRRHLERRDRRLLTGIARYTNQHARLDRG